MIRTVPTRFRHGAIFNPVRDSFIGLVDFLPPEGSASMSESATPSNPSPNQLEADRRAKLEKIRALGIDPFGQRIDGLQSIAAARDLPKNASVPEPTDVAVKIAGRLIFIRDMGKLWFVRLRDESGEIQVALDAKRLGERDIALRKLLDLGDLISVTGPVGTTKTGETTIWASELQIACKTLNPPPAKWEGLTDVEVRYRQRYADLAYNPEVMRTMKLRIAIVDEMRNYLRALGFDEVETPMLQPIHGGAAARPFVTHHNALDMKLFMRIAPELYLKRLLVGGFGKVFEINRNFRNEGISPRHNPEFTMLEAYAAYWNWEKMAELVEGMICHVAEKVIGTLKIEHKNETGEVIKTIDLSQRPWRRASMAELVEEKTGWKFDKQSLAVAPVEIIDAVGRALGERATKGLEVDREYLSDDPADAMAPGTGKLKAHAADKELQYLLALTPAEQLQTLYEKLVEPNLINPTFVTRVPGVIIPLAKRCKDDDYFADVYELAINGQEISPGYTELNDPDVQAAQFRSQVGDREEQQAVDEDFLTALRYGMPPAGGIGLGIDRLVMMLTGAPSIRDVILFPLMRPQG
jgi:lysyl-tRNA synthetase, class II